MEDKLKAFEGSKLNEVCSQYRQWAEKPPKKRIFDTNIAVCRESGAREFSGYWYVLLVRWNEVRKDRPQRTFTPEGRDRFERGRSPRYGRVRGEE